MDSLVFLSFGLAGKTEYASDGSKLEEGSITEIVEVSWIIANPTSLEVIREEQHFCKSSSEVMKSAIREGIMTEDKAAALETTLSDALTALSETLFRTIISKNLKSRLVTFGANSFRLGFVKEASSKLVQVPNFLKRCSLFDINQEIYKWLGSRIQGKYEKFGLAGLAQSLNIAHAPIVSALDKCRVMVKIMASILSSTDSKDLFIKLADMTVDYDQFIEEESKVILLAGLCPKITQPELMTWFSERGLKPIRLLTVQDPTSGASSGVCLAIFASHSEAKRTFSLNMDFMGSRLIEVSPSSQSFCATVHLTPLPAVAPVEKVAQPVVAATTGTYNYNNGNSNGNGIGKNYHRERSPVRAAPHPRHHSGHHSSYNSNYKSSHQPPHQYPQSRGYSFGYDRDPHPPHEQYNGSSHYHSGPPSQKVVPGDWTCQTRGCESYNYSFRHSCFKCHCPKPQLSKYSSSHSSGYSSNHSSGYRHQSAYHAHDHNHRHNSYQNSPYPPPSRPPRATTRVGDWYCPNSMCGFENFASRVACLRCGAENPMYKVAPHAVPAPVPLSTSFRPGDWYCPGCNSHNFATRQACMRCSAHRSEPVSSTVPSNDNASQPLLPGDWHCRKNNCGFHNFAKRMVCGRCGAPSGL